MLLKEKKKNKKKENNNGLLKRIFVCISILQVGFVKEGFGLNTSLHGSCLISLYRDCRTLQD
jgi:hypothetical protein